MLRARAEAAELRLAHARAQLSLGRRSWPSPNIETVESALRRAFEEVADQSGLAVRLLAPHEEWILWRRATSALVAEADSDGVLPLDTESLADALWRAARLAADWGIRPSDGDSAATETRWLMRVTSEVETAAAGMEAIPRHQLLQWLAGFGDALPKRPAPWRLTGPLPTAVESTLKRCFGPAAQADIASEVVTATPQVCVALDSEQELRLAAEWARRRLLNKPESRLRVIVPTLAAQQEQVERIFDEVLTPSRRIASSASSSSVDSPVSAFQIQANKTLRQTPPIRAALNTLSMLLAPRVDGEQLATWWAESFWGASSVVWRAQLSRHFRTRPLDELNRERWREQVRSHLDDLDVAAAECVGRLARADRLLTHSVSLSRQSPGQWADLFSELLEVMAWPGVELSGLGTDDQAALKAWQSLLEDFASTETALGCCDAPTALQTLRSLAGRQIFVPAMRDVGVHITAAFDSAVGCDGIWVCGLRADSWPQPPRVNGFISFAAMRTAGVPEIDAAGQYAIAERQLAQWRKSTSELMLSWAVVEQESIHLPSPLLQPWLPDLCDQGDDGRQWLTQVTPAAESLAHLIWQQRRSPERYSDERGLAWPSEHPLRGGVWALVDQHQCPFSAYARRRLRTGDPEQASLGIDAKLRGQLLHQLFEAIWRELGSSRQLLNTTPEGLQKIIDKALQRIDFRSLHARTSDDLSARLQRRELDRLAKVAEEALALERARPQAFTVSLGEESLTLLLGEARLDIRVDRVDQLADGGWLVIDYKSGAATSPKWTGDDFDAIQLWSYAEALGARMSGPLAGLAHFSLRSDKVGFSALTRSDQVLPTATVVDNLDSLQVEARERLQALAHAVLSGEAQVSPKKGACNFCELPLLCRKAEWLYSDVETD